MGGGALSGAMAKEISCTSRWAHEEFGRAKLGDARRRRRLVRMGEAAARAPAGRVSEVFRCTREREAAYDLLECDAVRAPAILAAMAEASVARCEAHDHVIVPVDGTSLSIVDRTKCKDFGAVGASRFQVAGLNVVNAIAVSPSGVPLGVLGMEWWRRPRKRTAYKRDKRPVAEKETQRWVDVIKTTASRLGAGGCTTKPWFQIDRQGDAWPILMALASSGALFTVRGAWNRCLSVAGGRNVKLRGLLAGRAVRATFDLPVAAGIKRSARSARVEVRTASAMLDMRDTRVKARHLLRVNVVHVREVGAPSDEQPIEWVLLTNASVARLEDVWRIVFAYSLRWRIEDFHRAWKNGGCRVEQTQLRAADHVMKWATLLAAVAMRSERLKHLARQTPDEPASVELSPHEICALIVLKREQKKLKEVVPETMPTIGQAVLWLAELGGYTGRSSGGPPGAITIRRGLDDVESAAKAIAVIADRPELLDLIRPNPRAH